MDSRDILCIQHMVQTDGEGNAYTGRYLYIIIKNLLFLLMHPIIIVIPLDRFYSKFDRGNLECSKFGLNYFLKN